VSKESLPNDAKFLGNGERPDEQQDTDKIRALPGHPNAKIDFNNGTVAHKYYTRNRLKIIVFFYSATYFLRRIAN